MLASRLVLLTTGSRRSRALHLLSQPCHQSLQVLRVGQVGNDGADDDAVMGVQSRHQTMPLELIQQRDDAIALLRLTAQLAQVNLQLRNQLINSYQCLSGARTAFLFVGDEMLAQNGDQQGLLQVQPLPAHKGGATSHPGRPPRPDER